jgi:hypothetical protein
VKITEERKKAMDEAARLLGLKIIDYEKAAEQKEPVHADNQQG